MVISQKRVSLCSSSEAADYLKDFLVKEDDIGQEREHFWVIVLNTKNVVKYVEMVSLGSLSSAIVHPREVFRRAVHTGAAAIILGHNHPSGDSRPSQEDILLTKRLKEAGTILGIEVLDHVIIGDCKFSFRDNGLMG